MIELAAYSPQRPLLLITDYPPNLQGGGAVIIRSLMTAEDRARVIWAWPATGQNEQQSDDSYPLITGSRSFARWLSRRSVEIDMLRARSLADEMVGLAKRKNVAALWLVLHGALTHIATRLITATALPFHVTVHDDPAYGVALMSRRHLALVPLIARDVRKVLARARSVDVISAGMARRYRHLYDVDPIVVHRGIGVRVQPSPAITSKDLLEIGVLGNTYGFDQLVVLADASYRAAAALGTRARIVVVGQGPGERLRDAVAGRVEVEVLGHLEEAAAVERLRRCFLLYLYYPFSSRAAVMRQTAFPTKLSTYVQAARPILVHAPDDSTVAELAKQHGYVSYWRDLEAQTGAATISRAWQDPEQFTSRHVQADLVREQYYDLDRNRAALLGALNGLLS